jgi:glycosyltransferase involved in cell wall biosynthesis
VVDFSVVIPTVRRRDLVLQAVASVVGQTLPPAEIIVVVDRPLGEPSDGTEQALAARFPEVRVIHSGGRGDGAARQRGIAAASGTWVAFLDDDDLWHRDRLASTERHVVGHPACAAVHAPLWLFAADRSAPDEAYGLRRDVVAADLTELHTYAASHPPANDFSYLDIHGRSLDLMLERNRGAIPTATVRRDVLERCAPAPDHLRTGADWLLFTDVAAETEWCLIQEGLAFVRIHPQQSSRDPAVARDLARVMALQWQRHGDHAPRPAASYADDYVPMLRLALWSCLRRGRWDDARAVATSSARVLPRRRDRAAIAVPGRIATRFAPRRTDA